MAILEVQHIEKHFDNTQVLKDIRFSLEKGQALSIIGSSGSGKTTLLRCLNFLETPNKGSISVDGKVIFDAADGDVGAVDCVNAAGGVNVHQQVFAGTAFGGGH